MSSRVSGPGLMASRWGARGTKRRTGRLAGAAGVCAPLRIDNRLAGALFGGAGRRDTIRKTGERVRCVRAVAPHATQRGAQLLLASAPRASEQTPAMASWPQSAPCTPLWRPPPAAPVLCCTGGLARHPRGAGAPAAGASRCHWCRSSQRSLLVPACDRCLPAHAAGRAHEACYCGRKARHALSGTTACLGAPAGAPPSAAPRRLHPQRDLPGLTMPNIARAAERAVALVPLAAAGAASALPCMCESAPASAPTRKGSGSVSGAQRPRVCAAQEEAPARGACVYLEEALHGHHAARQEVRAAATMLAPAICTIFG